MYLPSHYQQKVLYLSGLKMRQVLAYRPLAFENITICRDISSDILGTFSGHFDLLCVEKEIMSWKDFFTTLKASELFGNTSMAQILIQLFQAAGAVNDFSEDTAKSWINGKRNCKVSTYFPEGKLNNITGAINFFRNRPESNLKKLQKLFRKIESDNPIDSKTGDMDIFCQSLVNQFLDLLKFKRLDMPDRTASSFNNASMCDNTTSCDPDKEAPRNRISEADVFPQRKSDTSAQISIPEEYHLCLYCKNWKGNIQDARCCEDGVYGKCLLYQKDILSSNKKICGNFNPACERIPILSQTTDFLKKNIHNIYRFPL